MESIVVGEFKDTGINEINIDLVTKKWNHLWWISEWNSVMDGEVDYRLIKYVRKDSPMTAIKLTISKEQVDALNEKLGLERTPSGVFRSGFSWRRRKDVEILDAWRREKYKIDKL